ncbi:hypothetical protein FQA39_LY11861 [Lamprigera yunnana]|nr:hypothetical protein FQA39_LY11861 [Lamprigera yunnana]
MDFDVTTWAMRILQGRDKDIGGTTLNIASISKYLEQSEKMSSNVNTICLKQSIDKQGSSTTSYKRFQYFRSSFIVVQFAKSYFIEMDAEEFSTCVMEHVQEEDNAAVELELIL